MDAPSAAAPPPGRCAACGTDVEAHAPAAAEFCAACRARLVRRAGRWALVPSLVVAGLYAALVLWSGLLQSPLMIFWVAVGAVLAYVAYKVGRRVAFDVLRERTTDAEG